MTSRSENPLEALDRRRRALKSCPYCGAGPYLQNDGLPATFTHGHGCPHDCSHDDKREYETANARYEAERVQKIAGHSMARHTPCSKCGDMDGCHLWRQAVKS